jgi:hypothetical protein
VAIKNYDDTTNDEGGIQISIGVYNQWWATLNSLCDVVTGITKYFCNIFYFNF